MWKQWTSPQFVLSFFIVSFLSLVLFMPEVAVHSAPTAVTFTTPGASGATVAELDEFATIVMGDPWDMDEVTDLYYYRAESQMTNSAFANGIYSAKMTNGNGGERITLASMLAANNAALRIGKNGYDFPIDANKYRYLTFRIYKSCASCTSGFVQWFADDSYASSVMGMKSYSLPGSAGWHTMVVDLKTGTTGSRAWTGTLRELIIHPFSNGANATVKLDWARLTAENPNTARPYTLQWTGGGAVDLYASPGNKTLDNDDILIATGKTGSYTFQTGALPAGDYYIAAKEGSSVSWSSGPLKLNSVPDATIDSPSMTSGAAYAETVIGNAWDMDDAGDLNDVLPAGWETCVSNPSFTNGIFQATLSGCSNDGTHTDARFIVGGLNPAGSPDPVIDTSKYRYFSFRYFQAGEQTVGDGWIARLGWWQKEGGGLPGESTVMSRDVIIYEGWNTYKLDLWAADIVDEAHPVQRAWTASAPNRLRFDPSELKLTLMPAQIKLDWMKLTAVDEVKRGDSYPIAYSGEAGASYTFYYDTDTNPGNGRNLIGTTTLQTTAVSQPSNVGSITADTFVYLPMIMNKFAGCTSDACYYWDTGSVAAGTYYVCLEGDDGFNTIYRCSEAPMIIR